MQMTDLCQKLGMQPPDFGTVGTGGPGGAGAGGAGGFDYAMYDPSGGAGVGGGGAP